MQSHALVHAASLTNSELFTAVIGAITRSFGTGKKSGKKRGAAPTSTTGPSPPVPASDGTPARRRGDWQLVASRVAAGAARGDVGCCRDEDYVGRYRKESAETPPGEGVTSKDCKNAIRETLGSLSEDECYRARLANAFDALSSSPNELLSVREVAGLVRISSHLRADGDPSSKTSALDLQAQAIGTLLKAMPRLQTRPVDIFNAVQLPVLQNLQFACFARGGVQFGSTDNERIFQGYLSTFGTDDKAGGVEESAARKRKRSEDISSSPSEHGETAKLDMTALVIEAAELARKAAVRAKHGAIIYITDDRKDGPPTVRVLGRGYNHDCLVDRVKYGKNKFVIHSENHAVVDAIRRYGEEECTSELFPKATVLIVELHSDYAYDQCHPCPKCNPLLRGVGITSVVHTTADGSLETLDISPSSAELLEIESVRIPFMAACDEAGIACKMLEDTCKVVPKEN